MSAQDELPPGCTADNSTGGRFPWRIRYHSGETSLSSYMHRHEIIEWAQARYDTEELATMRAAVERCAELEAALVMVSRAYEIGFGGTYGLDGSPYELAREIEESGLLSDTPTEGECSECGATSEERGLLPCDMPGCPHAPPTEGGVMNRAEWPEGYGATGGHGFWHLEGYYRPWSVGSDTERHDITTDEPGALSFAAMMADRDGLRAELAKVTAERNEARRIAGQHRDAHESDTERRGGAPMRVRHPWERATPTEGEK